MVPTFITRLSQIAMRVGTTTDNVHNVTIWGNHSSTQFPDVAHAYITKDGGKTPVYEAVNNDAWLKGDFITVSQSTFSLYGMGLCSCTCKALNIPGAHK